jgi:uncharacterized RmlC-like cupin family protein
LDNRDSASQNDRACTNGEALIRVVRGPSETETLQGLPYFTGVSAETVGSTGIALSLVIVPPGGEALPHVHRGFETAIYVLEGRVRTRYGERLEHGVETQPGDFIFIPPGLLHQPVNLSATERAVGLVARNEAAAQETAEIYDAAPEQSPRTTRRRSP